MSAEQEMRALIDDPAWVLERYREAKAILEDIGVTINLPDDLRERVDDFSTETAMDGCTTFGSDCRCNFPERGSC